MPADIEMSFPFSESIEYSGNRSGWRNPLLAEIEPLKEFVVLAEIFLLKVVEKFASPASHGYEATAGGEVLPVWSKVLGQMIDASG